MLKRFRHNKTCQMPVTLLAGAALSVPRGGPYAAPRLRVPAAPAGGATLTSNFGQGPSPLPGPQEIVA